MQRVDADKVSLIASVAKEFTATVKAGDIIKHLGQELGGKGGGKPDMAQGGAPIVTKLCSGNERPCSMVSCK